MVDQRKLRLDQLRTFSKQCKRSSNNIWTILHFNTALLISLFQTLFCFLVDKMADKSLPMLCTKIFSSTNVQCPCKLCEERIDIELGCGKRFDVRRDVLQSPPLSGGKENREALLDILRQQRLREMFDDRRLRLGVIYKAEA